MALGIDPQAEGGALPMQGPHEVTTTYSEGHTRSHTSSASHPRLLLTLYSFANEK